MNISLTQLRIFTKVVETKSVTKTARVFNMTQPAISIQLKNFQSQFEVPLIQTVGKRIHVTDFGLETAKSVQQILESIDELTFQTKDFSKLQKGKLKIASASNGKYMIPFFISEFLDNFEGIELNLDISSRSSAINSLRRNETEFAFVSSIPTDLDVHHEDLLTSKLYLIGKEPEFNPKKHLIYRERGSSTRSVMDLHFGMDKYRYAKKMELNSHESVKMAVLAGIGMSLMSIIGLRRELEQGDLHIIPTDNLPEVMTWRLIWLKGKTLSPAGKAFIEYVKNEKGRIYQNKFSWMEKFSDNKGKKA